MFDTLSDRLEGVFKKLKGQGRITERNIEDALREVRQIGRASCRERVFLSV